MEAFSSTATVCNRPTLSPGTIVGGYSLLRVIGAGGLGVVYEARHQWLDKRFAVKALQSELLSDPDACERFRREGRTAAKLRHPNVVDVSDVALDGDTPYLVMELLQGEDLASLIAREGSLSVETTIDVLVPVVSALMLSHECGIVHRDLKPKNVFLNRSALGAVIPKVVDFGVSKVVNETQTDLTGSNACVGTPQYMSPEQARGDKQIDHRCDQFSLGVMAYECLTGWRPFTGDSLFAVLSAVINRDPPSVSTINHAVSPELAAIVAKLMAKAPDNRFDSMYAVGQALLPFASSGIRLAYGNEFSPAAVISPALPEMPRAQTASRVTHSAVRLPALASTWLRLQRSATLAAAALAATLGLAWGVSPRSSVRGATQSPPPMGDSRQGPALTSQAPPVRKGAPAIRADVDTHYFEVSTTDVYGSGDLRNRAGLQAASQSRLQPDRASPSWVKSALGARNLRGLPSSPSATVQVAHSTRAPLVPATSAYPPNALPSANANHPERGVNGALILP